MSKEQAWKTGLERLDDMVDASIAEVVEDDNPLLQQCSHAVCVRKTPEALEQIPDMWKDQIGFGNCAMCDEEIFFRNNIPEGPMLICYECAAEHLLDADEAPKIVTRKSGVDEIRGYLRKKGN